MEQAITEFINCKRVAVVGFSRNGRKFGNAAYTELLQRGYEVHAVHPTERRIGNVECAPNLAALRGRVDAVFVSIPAAQAVSVLREAADAGITRVWVQQGAESPEVIAESKRLGLSAVTGKCLLMYIQPVRSIHRWHRAAVNFMGRL